MEKTPSIPPFSSFRAGYISLRILHRPAQVTLVEAQFLFGRGHEAMAAKKSGTKKAGTKKAGTKKKATAKKAGVKKKAGAKKAAPKAAKK
jgi:topoisomerase IA-like protein